jgi:hypothetical protein
MTTKTTQQASRTIASALADLRELAEEVTQAHDALTLPESDEQSVDWQAVIDQVDRMGVASHRLATVAQNELIPALKTVKGHAKTALDEVTHLNHQLALTPTPARSRA